MLEEMISFDDGDEASVRRSRFPLLRPQTPVGDSQQESIVGPKWPDLDNLGLSGAQRAARADGIGGSDANVILSGDSERVIRLWREKTGEFQPEVLTGNVAVMLGCWSEDFNRQWYQRTTGNLVVDCGLSAVCSRHNWRRCTLDGLVPAIGAIWEAKHTSGFTKSDEALERYMPQLQHNMAVVGCDRAILSVIFGNARWETFEIASDWLYQEELLIAEMRFWDCVRAGEAPVPAPVPLAPKPVGVREICLEGNNAWASAAIDWLAYREPARRHGVATANLKGLVEADVKRAFGHGIEARRSKSGALSIRELAI